MHRPAEGVARGSHHEVPRELGRRGRVQLQHVRLRGLNTNHLPQRTQGKPHQRSHHRVTIHALIGARYELDVVE